MIAAYILESFRRLYPLTLRLSLLATYAFQIAYYALEQFSKTFPYYVLIMVLCAQLCYISWSIVTVQSLNLIMHGYSFYCNINVATGNNTIVMEKRKSTDIMLNNK